MTFKSVLLTAALLAALPAAHAVTLVAWDFQVPPADLTGSTAPSVAASTGTGTAGGFHAASATTWSVSVDQTRSGTGPDGFKLAYSTNGSSFTDFASYTVAAVTWNGTTAATGSTYTFDLSGVGALNNQASVVLRLVSTVTPASGGTNRVDNFTVMATPVPEPGTWAMLLAGAAGVGFVARRRKG